MCLSSYLPPSLWHSPLSYSLHWLGLPILILLSRTPRYNEEAKWTLKSDAHSVLLPGHVPSSSSAHSPCSLIPSGSPGHPGTRSLWKGNSFDQVSSPKLPFAVGMSWRCVPLVSCLLPLSFPLQELSPRLPRIFYDIGSPSLSRRRVHFSAKWRGRQQQWRKEKRSCHRQRRAVTLGEWAYSYYPCILPSHHPAGPWSTSRRQHGTGRPVLDKVHCPAPPPLPAGSFQRIPSSQRG